MAEMKIGRDIFNVVVEGPDDAPALMLSNSLGTNLHMWDAQVPALAKHFRVIRYDSRGHGESVAEDGPYSIDQLGQDALAILDALGIGKAHFVGLSMGGMVGMWLMSHHPDRIGRAVLANTGAHLGNPDLWNMRIRTARNQGMEALVAGTLERWFTPEFMERGSPEIDRVAEMVRTTPPLGYASCCAAIRDMDQREAVRSIPNDVLVVVGTHDPATPPAMGGLLANSIRNARLIAVEAAHISNVEAEHAFTRAVVGFLTAPASSARKSAAKMAKKAAKKVAAKKTAAKKAGKKAGKKAAKKAGKKAAKKVAGKAAKKAAKKAAGKAARKAAGKSAGKKAGKKAARKTGKKAAKKAASKKSARKSSSKKSASKKSASKKSASKAARKAGKKAVRKGISSKGSSRKSGRR